MNSAADTRRVLAAATPADGVEFDSEGVPKSLRLFRRGSNPTDHGDFLFTEGSADLLLFEQARRGNRYSIDINHGSLDKTLPIENQRAVGSFAVAVRGGELWAVDMKFSASTRAQLRDSAWPSVSPAFDVTKDGEICSLTNLALTPNPATHGATRIAASVSRRAAADEAPEEAPTAEELAGIIETLQTIAKGDGPDAEKARAMLKSVGKDPAQSAAVRAAACRAMDRALASVSLRERMCGVSATRGVVREGTHQVFHPMSPSAAHRWLATRSR